LFDFILKRIHLRGIPDAIFRTQKKFDLHFSYQMNRVKLTVAFIATLLNRLNKGILQSSYLVNPPLAQFGQVLTQNELWNIRGAGEIFAWICWNMPGSW